MGAARQAGLFVGRQPRRRLAAPHARRGRERLAASARRSRSTSHAAMANAYDAGAANLPFAVFRGYRGVDLPRVNPTIRSVTCPYTGEVLATVPAIRPDVAIIHAQRADRDGNVLIEGIVGVQKEAVLAAQAVDRDGRGDRRRPRRALAQRGDPAGMDGCRDRRGAGRRLSLLCPRLLQARPTPSTRRGTRSPATATPSSRGCARTCSTKDASALSAPYAARRAA